MADLNRLVERTAAMIIRHTSFLTIPESIPGYQSLFSNCGTEKSPVIFVARQPASRLLFEDGIAGGTDVCTKTHVNEKNSVYPGNRLLRNFSSFSYSSIILMLSIRTAVS